MNVNLHSNSVARQKGVCTMGVFSSLLIVVAAVDAVCLAAVVVLLVRAPKIGDDGGRAEAGPGVGRLERATWFLRTGRRADFLRVARKYGVPAASVYATDRERSCRRMSGLEREMLAELDRED